MEPDSTTPGGRSTIWYLLVLAAVLLDFSSTLLGLRLGLPEAGPVAAKLLGMVGLAYFGLEAIILYSLYYITRKTTGLQPGYAALVAVVGPWLAGWHNIGILLGLRVS